MAMYHKIAIIAAVLLPFFNLPLIFRIIKRRSAEDISTFWATGVWLCFLLMAPSGFKSQDLAWRVFSIINLVLFSGVFITVLVYKRIGGSRCKR